MYISLKILFKQRRVKQTKTALSKSSATSTYFTQEKIQSIHLKNYSSKNKNMFGEKANQVLSTWFEIKAFNLMFKNYEIGKNCKVMCQF